MSLLPGRETTVGQHGLSPERQDLKGMQAATGLPITFRFPCPARGSGPSSEAMKIRHPHQVNSYPCLFCQLWYQEQCGCCGGQLGVGSCDHGRDPSSQQVVSLGIGGVGLCFLLFLFAFSKAPCPSFSWTQTVRDSFLGSLRCRGLRPIARQWLS